MSKKKENWNKLYENMPSNKNKDSVFKPTKLETKNYGEKNVFEKEKTEFLKKKFCREPDYEKQKKRRGNSLSVFQSTRSGRSRKISEMHQSPASATRM